MRRRSPHPRPDGRPPAHPKAGRGRHLEMRYSPSYATATTVSSSSPPGVWTETTSPARRPSSARASGATNAIAFAAGSASSTPTIWMSRTSPPAVAARTRAPKRISVRSAGGGGTTAVAIRCSSSVRARRVRLDVRGVRPGRRARVQRRQLVAEGLEPARRHVVRHARGERRAPPQDRRLRRPVILGERFGHAPL